ncbi:MAG: hypothetical protein PVG54_20180 [Anaerolineae bacterium]|jgi:hypothetical protein
MKDKTCIVTGANVVMLCRSQERGEVARVEIQERSGNANVELIAPLLGLPFAGPSLRQKLK